MAWSNVKAFRERVEAFAQMAAREENLPDVRVYVTVDEPRRDKPRAVRIEVEHVDVDPTTPLVEHLRGVKWEEN